MITRQFVSRLNVRKVNLNRKLPPLSLPPALVRVCVWAREEYPAGPTSPIIPRTNALPSMKAETGGLLSAGSEISLELGFKTRSVAFYPPHSCRICSAAPCAARRNFSQLQIVTRLDLQLLKSRQKSLSGCPPSPSMSDDGIDL